MNIFASRWFNFLFSRKLMPVVVGVFACLILSIILGASIPRFIKSFYDSFSNDQKFLHYSILLGSIFVFEYLNRAIFQIQINKIIKEMIFFVRSSTYGTWLRSYEIKSSKQNEDPYPLGEVMARVMSDSDAIRELITSGAFGIIIDLCFIISCLVSFLFLNITSGLLLMVIEVTACIGLIWGSKYMAKIFLEVRKASGFMSRKIANMVGGLKENYFNQDHNYASKECLKTFNEFLKKQLTANVWDASYYSLAESLFPLLLLAIVTILPYSKITEVAVIVAIIDLIQRSINPIKDVASKISNIQRAATGVTRIDSFIKDLEEGGLSASHDYKLEGKVDSFHLKVDEFKYPRLNENSENDFKLENINIETSTGDYIGILGHSGSGKSTVLNLAALNLCPKKMKLTLGLPKNELNYKYDDLENIGELKSHIGLVSQDSHVFSDTLIFNISLNPNEDVEKFTSFWNKMSAKFEYLKTWGIKPKDKIDLEQISLGQKADNICP